MRAIIREELQKALAVPAGSTVTHMSPAYLAALGNPTGPQVGVATPLPRDTTNAVFPPGIPLLPSAVDPLLPSGRPAPRRYEYPVAWNVNIESGVAPFTLLRDVAEKVSIVRRCIEVRKSTLCGLEWGFTIDATRAQHLAQAAGVSRQTVTADLKDQYADDIDRLHRFWMKPDRINGWTFADWLGACLEEQLVIDALALYPHLNMGGGLHSVELVDGSTIRPLLDHRGATPLPPQVAYQQVLYGFPRNDFTQLPPEEVKAEFMSAVYGRIEGSDAPTDTLIYKVRHRRVNSPYGFSNVEQALSDADLWLKRVDWLRQEYAAGVTPEMLVQVDMPLTPEQLRQYESVFNDELSGRSAERHRARFLPAGFAAMFPPGIDQKFASDLDLHLIRLVCAAFDVLPSSLGFTPNHGMGGMGGMGHQQAEQDSEGRRGTKPTAEWFTDLINEISSTWLGMPPEVTFTFRGLDPEDDQKEASLLQGQVAAGLKTVNEGRDQMNLPRFSFPEADTPFVSTATGPVWLDPEAAPAIPGAPAPQGSLEGNKEPTKKPPRDEQVQTVPDNKPAVPVAGYTRSKPHQRPGHHQVVGAQRAEQKAFMGFLERRSEWGRGWRDFAFKTLPADVAEAANRLASEGDVDAVKALFAMNDDG